jgi:hypothetical protein
MNRLLNRHFFTLCFLAMTLSVAAEDSMRQPRSDQDAKDQPYELYYSLRSSIRTVKVDADLWAGGRLLMQGHAASDGGLQLSLIRAIEAPWKFYWIDRLGPVGEEVKLATVVTLDEASWEALQAARDKADVFGAEIHQEWLQEADKKRDLDGTFAFVVIGDPDRRFEVSIQPSGEVVQIKNRLTDRWLNGPFDRWIGAWGPETATGKSGSSVQGYWFWNQGEALPFSYEPHTYHALEAALQLLAQPLAASGQEPMKTSTLSWENPLPLALEVLRTLAPKLHRPTPPPTHLPVAVEVDDQSRVAHAVISIPHEGLELDRKTFFSPDWAHPTSDHVFVRVLRPHDSLTLSVGYAISDRVLDRSEGQSSLPGSQEFILERASQ